MKANKPLMVFLPAAAVLLLDLLTKQLALRLPEEGINLGILKLALSFNTGSAFGIFAGNNTALIFLTIAIIGFILYIYPDLEEKKWVNLSLGLILGGALGNLIDRVIYGHVIDFIDFGFWPAFNIADSALTVGAIILIIYYMKK